MEPKYWPPVSLVKDITVAAIVALIPLLYSADRLPASIVVFEAKFDVPFGASELLNHSLRDWGVLLRPPQLRHHRSICMISSFEQIAVPIPIVFLLN